MRCLLVLAKYIGSAHWSCNVKLKLTKNVPVLVHNFEDYGIHLIMQETGKFDVKTSGIPNGLEKCMAYTINKSLVFIDSMQFMNSSVDVLVTNLSDNHSKYLSQVFSSDLLQLVKQKEVYQ